MSAPTPAERGITGRGITGKITRRQFLKGAAGLAAAALTDGACLSRSSPGIFAQQPEGPPKEATPTPVPPPEFRGGTLPPTREQVEELIKAGRLVDFYHPDFVELKEALPSSYSLAHLLEPEPRQQRDWDCLVNQVAGLLSCHIRRLYGVDFWDPTKPEENPNPGFVDQLAEDLPINIYQATEITDAHGICMNNLSPNYEEMDLFNGYPSEEQFRQAERYKTQGAIQLYYRWPELPPVNLDEVLPNFKAYLVSGFPFILDVDVFSRIYDAQSYSNTVPPPRPEENRLFFHSLLVVGYDDNWSWTDPDSSISYRGAFEVRNTWGPWWGYNGNAKLPYGYLVNERVNGGWIHAADFVPPARATTCPMLPDAPFRPRLCCDLADVTGDGVVRIDDIMQIVNHWGETPQSPLWDKRFDLDGDGVVTINDIMHAAARWRDRCS